MDHALALTSDLVGVSTDEDAARRAREQYRETGIPSVPADAVVAGYLEEDERLLAVRPDTELGRIDETTHSGVRDEGSLYITNHRLLHIRGDVVSAIPLADIEELTMAEDRILVTLAGARGMTIDASEPRQLRVLLAAAKSAIR